MRRPALVCACVLLSACPAHAQPSSEGGTEQPAEQQDRRRPRTATATLRSECGSGMYIKIATARARHVLEEEEEKTQPPRMGAGGDLGDCYQDPIDWDDDFPTVKDVIKTQDPSFPSAEADYIDDVIAEHEIGPYPIRTGLRSIYWQTHINLVSSLTFGGNPLASSTTFSKRES